MYVLNRADALLFDIFPDTYAFENAFGAVGQGNSALDGTEIVVQYLQSLPNRTADPELHRIRLLAPLPASKFGFPEIQSRSAVRPRNAPTAG